MRRESEYCKIELQHVKDSLHQLTRQIQQNLGNDSSELTERQLAIKGVECDLPHGLYSTFFIIKTYGRAVRDTLLWQTIDVECMASVCLA